jgi:photosystem II stability/assembly factor-like uncharacterized protein
MRRYPKGVPTLLCMLTLLSAGSVFAQDEEAAAPVKPRPAEMMPLASKSLLLDVTNTGERLVAVGDRGHILLSANGNDWAQAPVPVRAPLTAVHFVDAQNGWAVGHDATILRTQDGGQTWTLQNFEPELEYPFLDVLFLDAERGFAVGAYGLMYQTFDGGESWNEADAPAIRDEEVHFNSITRLADGQLFIAGEMGMLGVSADQGQTWERLESPYKSSFFGALPMGNSGALIYGLRGTVYTATDVRGKWTELQTGTVATMFGGTTLPDGRMALVGLNGTVILTDGVSPPQVVKTPAGTPLSAVISFGDAMLAVGESGVQRAAFQ